MTGNKFFKRLLSATAVLATTLAFATSIPNNASNPKTFLGPTGHLGFVKAITDDSAFAIAGEAGPKNYRLDGTIGWEFTYNQRIKATAEYLRQRLTYSFFTGRQDVWMGQAAVGADYQYDFRQVMPYNTLLDLSAYYSHVPSHSLGATTGSFVNSLGKTVTYVDRQRVAGSNAAGISPAITIVTIDGTSAGIGLNYDNVHYDTKNRSGLNVKGLGGTAKLGQAITDDIKIGMTAAVRKPFNNYGADLSVDNIECYGTWVLRLFGDYTIGKSTLPSSYNVGIGADYLFDVGKQMLPPPPTPQQYKDNVYKDRGNYKDLVYKDFGTWEEPESANKELLTWIADPAAYMPTVVAVPDEKVTKTVTPTPSPSPTPTPCVPPSLISPIPDQGGSSATYSFNVSGNFAGSNLTFSINYNGAQTVCASVSGGNVNVTGNAPGCTVPDLVGISITATNSCGSVTSNTFTAFL